jgi:hypothetical protein
VIPLACSKPTTALLVLELTPPSITMVRREPSALAGNSIRMESPVVSPLPWLMSEIRYPDFILQPEGTTGFSMSLFPPLEEFRLGDKEIYQAT